MKNIIRAIILDDGYHDKYIVCEDDIHKNSFYSFVNKLALPHNENYLFKTIHFEDVCDDDTANAFETIDSSTELFHSETTAKAFEILWNSEDAVDGVDVY